MQSLMQYIKNTLAYNEDRSTKKDPLEYAEHTNIK